jgi:hypothetical protein
MPDISSLDEINDKDQRFNEAGPGNDIGHWVIGEAKNRGDLTVSTKVAAHSDGGIAEQKEQGDHH